MGKNKSYKIIRTWSYGFVHHTNPSHKIRTKCYEIVLDIPSSSKRQHEALRATYDLSCILNSYVYPPLIYMTLDIIALMISLCFNVFPNDFYKV